MGWDGRRGERVFERQAIRKHTGFGNGLNVTGCDCAIKTEQRRARFHRATKNLCSLLAFSERTGHAVCRKTHTS